MLARKAAGWRETTGKPGHCGGRGIAQGAIEMMDAHQRRGTALPGRGAQPCQPARETVPFDGGQARDGGARGKSGASRFTMVALQPCGQCTLGFAIGCAEDKFCGSGHKYVVGSVQQIIELCRIIKSNPRFVKVLP